MMKGPVFDPRGATQSALPRDFTELQRLLDDEAAAKQRVAECDAALNAARLELRNAREDAEAAELAVLRWLYPA